MKMKSQMPLSKNTSLASERRRAILKIAAIATGELALGFSLSSGAATLVETPKTKNDADEVKLTAWLRIRPDNRITVMVSQSEIGQGISTTLPAILVDELGADWSSIDLAAAPFAPAFRNPKIKWMFTGNSESAQSFYDLMRDTGAAARAMLIQVAANRWMVNPSECIAENSFVIHSKTSRRYSFGALAADAAQLAVPEHRLRKPANELHLVGRSLQRVDIPSKVDGSAIFGIDVVVPNMAYAAIRRCPVAGGKLIDFNERAILSEPGVDAVVPFPDGLAVVAQSFWSARNALIKYPPKFDLGPNSDLNTEKLEGAYLHALERGPFAIAVNESDASMHAADAKRSFSFDYYNAFAAHATMEPMNCTANVQADFCEIWAPTQGQEFAHVALKTVLRLSDEQVIVNRTSAIGGGFGRRLLPDFVVQAALISKASMRPVKLIWDREEDFAQDYYRPASAIRLTSTVAADGYPAAIEAKVVSPTILLPVYPPISAMLEQKRIDPSALEGMMEIPYSIAEKKVNFHLLKTSIPTSVMRTTGYGPNLFALECFIDELARQAHIDPLTYRRHLLRDNSRALAVINKVAQLSNWESVVGKKDAGMGIAFASAFGSLIAQVLEVSLEGKQVRITRSWTVVDCGTVLDPGIAAAGIEGGIIFGIAYAKTEITFEHGHAMQSNFNEYELPYLAQAPDMKIEFISSGGSLGGIGELSPITVPPALSNAIFAAGGKRIRRMPVGRHDYQFA